MGCLCSPPALGNRGQLSIPPKHHETYRFAYENFFPDPTLFLCQVVITKEACTIVGDGRTQKEVATRVKQIRNLVENTEQEYEKEKLNERIARLSGGVAIIQASCCLMRLVEMGL